MPVLLLIGLLVLFVLFLKRGKRKPMADSNSRPIAQNWMGSSRLALLPYIDAQAVHETGGFESRIFREQNNLFGMKKPVTRRFVGSKNSDNPYMKYDSQRQAVEDLFLWMDSVNFPYSVSGSAQYVAELKKRNYFEDSIQTYLKGVNSALMDLGKKGVTGFKITQI